jgi:RimJ/RimL family protein N-acetyltransferase
VVSSAVTDTTRRPFGLSGWCWSGILCGVLLLTRRVAVRTFQSGDAEAFAEYRSDPEVARYQSWTPPVLLAEASAFITEFASADPRAPGWFQYAVELRDSAALIGDIGVNLHDNLMQADIGFTFGLPYQGYGYATEAVRCLLAHLFRECGVRRVSAECDSRNVRSARLLQRLGFKQEGHLRANTWIKGEWTDDLLFGLLAQDFA